MPTAAKPEEVCLDRNLASRQSDSSAFWIAQDSIGYIEYINTSALFQLLATKSCQEARRPATYIGIRKFGTHIGVGTFTR